jgi:hypothetical protein
VRHRPSRLATRKRRSALSFARKATRPLVTSMTAVMAVYLKLTVCSSRAEAVDEASAGLEGCSATWSKPRSRSEPTA